MTKPITFSNEGRAELEPIEIASIDEMRELQLQRLKWSVKHAYDNVAVYRSSFDAAGVHPNDIESLDDLAKLPFTTKADLRDNYPFGMFAVPREEVVRVHASSGTTGKPTVVGYSRNDLDAWATWLPAAFVRPAADLAIFYTMLTVMDCLLVVWVLIMEQSDLAAQWCQCLGVKRLSKFS